ncbi:hypothetical protein [Streptomyces tateyamensis]|uniref:hypothetical protein n=1 Tax=Streptomyces tateyamensis TaxID=565073 RepID=UPI001FE967AB|nr:hypothetical protein [Streptomyces tateyamensis]
MSTAAIPGAPLPVRTPGSRARGRHRRPERPEVPAGAPALLLAVPAAATPEAVALVDELVSVIRSENPGLPLAAGWLAGGSESAAAQESTADAAEGTQGSPTAERPRPSVEDLLAEAAAAGMPVPVLVPLLSGPHAYLAALQELAARAGAVVTDPLGPHPLLAEAVHVRLSEAGLARADRARLFAIATAADGVVLTTVGGEEAAAAAGITGVLLAARLAVPVVAAALDVPGSVAGAVEHLRATGAERPALAPLVIGPEAPTELLLAATEATGCPSAAPVGAYATVAQLITSAYLAVLPALLPAVEEEQEQAAEQAEAAE